MRAMWYLNIYKYTAITLQDVTSTMHDKQMEFLLGMVGLLNIVKSC